MRKTQIEGLLFECYPEMSNQYIWIISYPIWFAKLMRKTQIEGPLFDCYPEMSNQYIWIISYPVWSSTCSTH